MPVTHFKNLKWPHTTYIHEVCPRPHSTKVHLALQVVRWFRATPHIVNNVTWGEGFPTISSALRTARKKTSFSSYHTLNLPWLPGFYLLFSSQLTLADMGHRSQTSQSRLHPNVARSLTQVSSLWQASAIKANEAKRAKKMHRRY